MTILKRRAFFRGRMSRSTLAVLVLLVVLLAWRASQREPAGAPFAFDSAGPYVVKRVVDGDTLVLADETRVRLLGVDAPELPRDGQAGEPLAGEATNFLRQRIQGREVRLQFDRERRDQYHRVLAYVWSGDQLLNEELIRAGYSRAETRFRFNSAMKRRFLAAEEEARAARAGLWGLESSSR